MIAALISSLLVLLVTAVVVVECFGGGGSSPVPSREALARGIKSSPRAAALVAAVATFALALGILWGVTRDLPLPFTIRILVLLLGLAAVVVADVRHGVVPYLYLGVLIVVRVVLYVWEGIVAPSATLLVLRGEVLTALIIVVVLGLVRLSQRGGLGLGDIWVLALLPVFLGPRLALMSALAAFTVAFAYSLWVLLTRRKKRKEAFPLAPAILVGTLAVITYATFRGIAS